MTTSNNPRKHRLPRLSMHPLTPEAALAAFMAVDPAPVQKALRRMRRQRGSKPALPTG